MGEFTDIRLTKKDKEGQYNMCKAVEDIIAPLVYIVPLQLLAYYITVEKNYNPDRPRNLAKTVTV